MKKSLSVFLTLTLVLALPATLQAHMASRPGAKVYFLSPKNGETVTNPVLVKFGLKGMEVAPAGTLKENSGHHHLLVDVATLPNFDQPLPKDEKHIHFGGGQTETTVTLASGTHTLQLVFADGAHRVHHPPLVSEKITIHVKY